ncbi:hypothetical protein MTR67_027963 [Solanum verrucosum]|uniref:Uncharacterized protein n=2 Tax=Solanum TaxID=4107 RepID=A0A9J5YR60_SOLCO|nr:hypothetical protein H5410_032752 [Solanum commersonii]WMV34578.1 hypothetical protein MTR67_027963 [Solanum verrucosum]
MAVQAQYPSNAHLFNRAVQERKNPLGNDDYSLQPQPGGGSILDHTQMLFNPGGKNRGCIINFDRSELFLFLYCD